MKPIKFDALEGLFIRGKISPAVEFVQVDISSENDKNMQITTSSNADGEFTVGPLDPHQKYKINPIHHNYRFVSSGEQFKMTQILKTSLKAIFCNFQNA